MKFLITIYICLLSLAVFGQRKPNEFTEETNPSNSNFEFYSQKGGNSRRASFDNVKKGMLPNVQVTPIVYVPVSVGNMSNRGDFVKDPNGDLWYIDSAGDGIKFVAEDGSTTNELASFTSAGTAPVIFKLGDFWHKNSTDTVFIRGVGSWLFFAIRAGGGGSISAPVSRLLFGTGAGATSDVAATFEKALGLQSSVQTVRQFSHLGDTLRADGKRVVFYGNSITNGSQADTRFTFAKLFSRAMNAVPEIHATDGSGLYHASSCADSNFICRYKRPYSSQYLYAFLLYGPQNGSLDTTIDRVAYRTKYYQAIDSLTSKGWPNSKVVILGWVLTNLGGGASPTGINAKITALQDSIASEKGVRFVNLFAYMRDNGGLGLVAADNIHTNTKGHSVIAQAIVSGLGITKTSAYQKIEGDCDIDGDLLVGQTVTVGGTGVFGDKVTITGKSNAPALDIFNPASGFPFWTGTRYFGGFSSTDTFSVRYITGNGYANTFGLYHNSTPIYYVHNNNNLSIGTTTDNSAKLNVAGTGRFTNRVTIWPDLGQNNRSVLDLRNPNFSGNSYVEQRFFSATSADTFSIRNLITTGGYSLFGHYYNNAAKLVYSSQNNQVLVNTATDMGVGVNLGVNGNVQVLGKQFFRPATNNMDVLNFRNPTFATNSYLEQKFWTQGTTDTIRLRNIVRSGGDQYFIIMRNATEDLVVGLNGIGLRVATPTARLHLPAGTATASTAPLKFTSGPLLTTKEVGAWGFLTDKLYFTITTGTAEKEITMNDAALTPGAFPVATTNGRLANSTLTFANSTWQFGGGTSSFPGIKQSGAFFRFMLADTSALTPVFAAGRPYNSSSYDGSSRLVAEDAFRDEIELRATKASPTFSGNVTVPTLVMTGRIQGNQGADVASASDLTLGSGNLFYITGTTDITAITTAGWQNGSEVTFRFQGVLNLVHNTAGGGGTLPLFLDGASNIATTANDMITFKLTSAGWMQAAPIARL